MTEIVAEEFSLVPLGIRLFVDKVAADSSTGGKPISIRLNRHSWPEGLDIPGARPDEKEPHLILVDEVAVSNTTKREPSSPAPESPRRKRSLSLGDDHEPAHKGN